MKLDINQENQTLIIRRNLWFKLTKDVCCVQHLFDTRSKFFSDLIFLYLLPLCIHVGDVFALQHVIQEAICSINMHKITEDTWTCILQFFSQQKELSKAKSKMQKMSEDHKKDNEDALSRKIKEIEELKKQLQESIEEQERQAVQTQAHKQVLEKITMEKEALQVRDRGYTGQRS